MTDIRRRYLIMIACRALAALATVVPIVQVAHGAWIVPITATGLRFER